MFSLQVGYLGHSLLKNKMNNLLPTKITEVGLKLLLGGLLSLNRVCEDLLNLKDVLQVLLCSVSPVHNFVLIANELIYSSLNLILN